MFGKPRAARHRVWRQLLRASQSTSAMAALQHEIDGYPRLDTLAYADLPRVSVDLRRLVVVPRVFVHSEAFRRIDAILRADPEFAALAGGESLRTWFVLTVIDGMTAAVSAARISPEQPLPAGECWTVVAVNERFRWNSPIEGEGWLGHYYVLELRPVPLTRSVRKATSGAIARLEASLASVPPAGRGDMLRQAQRSVERLAPYRPAEASVQLDRPA